MAKVKSGLIVDQNGLPYERDLLEEERYPTRAIEGRPPFAGHLAFGMDPGTLGGIIRASDTGNTLQWMILAEEIEELFVHYAAVLSKRKRQVSQLPVRVEAAKDNPDGQRHADFVTKWLEGDLLGISMFDILDGLGKGFSVHEIMWKSEPGSVVPAELKYRPQRFFETSWIDGETIWVRDGAGFQDMQPHKFLVHYHKSKSGQAVRSGLTRAVCWLWMFSAFNLKDWALFCQGYGMPIRVGRYGPEASRGDKSVLWKAVSSIAGDVAAIIPKSMEIEFVEAGNRSGSEKLYAGRGDWLNYEVSKLVLGGTAGTDAVGKEHRGAEQDVERFDARLLSVSTTRQIAFPMIAYTFGPQPLGYPRIIVGQEEGVPLKDAIAGATDLGPQGLRVRASELRDKLGFSEPEAGDETVGGVPPAPTANPKIPREAVTPPETETQSFRPLRELITRHAAVPDELVEVMSARLAHDAAGALAGLTDTVRGVFDAAEDMHDLQRRLKALNLPDKEYAAAMARGMALAVLVGQASVMAEIGRAR